MARITCYLRLTTILIAIFPIFAPSPTTSGVMFFGYELYPGDIRLFQFDMKTNLATPVFENWEYFNSAKPELLGRNLLEISAGDQAVGPDNKKINTNTTGATGYFAPAMRYSKRKQKMEPVDYNVPRSLVAMATTLGVYPYVYDDSLKEVVDRGGYELTINPSNDVNINIYHILNSDWKSNSQQFRPIKLDNWVDDAKNSIEFIPSVHVTRWDAPSRILWAQLEPDSDMFDDSLSNRLSIFSQKSLRPDQVTPTVMDPSLNPSSPSMVSVKLSDRSSRPVSLPPNSSSSRSRTSVSSGSQLSGARSLHQRSSVAMSGKTDGSMLSVPSALTTTSVGSGNELSGTRHLPSSSSVNTHRSSQPRSSADKLDRIPETEIISTGSSNSSVHTKKSGVSESQLSAAGYPLPRSSVASTVNSQMHSTVPSSRSVSSSHSKLTQSTMPVAEIVVPPAPGVLSGTPENQNFATLGSPAPSDNGSGRSKTNRSSVTNSTTKSSRRGDSTDRSLNPYSPSIGSVKLSDSSIPLNSSVRSQTVSSKSGTHRSSQPSDQMSGKTRVTGIDSRVSSMLSVPSVLTTTSEESKNRSVGTGNGSSKSRVPSSVRTTTTVSENQLSAAQQRSILASRMSARTDGTKTGSPNNHSVKSPSKLPLPPSPLSGGLSPPGTPNNALGLRGLSPKSVSSRHSVSSNLTQSTIPVAEVVVDAQRGTPEGSSLSSPAPSSNRSGRSKIRGTTSTTGSSRRGDSTV